MTPKEKAEELVSSYFLLVQTIAQQKQCALIAVDEIYNEIDDNYDTLHSSDRKQYWQEVKNEIKQL